LLVQWVHLTHVHKFLLLLNVRATLLSGFVRVSQRSLHCRGVLCLLLLQLLRQKLLIKVSLDQVWTAKSRLESTKLWMLLVVKSHVGLLIVLEG